jgi:hypothetical protein
LENPARVAPGWQHPEGNQRSRPRRHRLHSRDPTPAPRGGPHRPRHTIDRGEARLLFGGRVLPSPSRSPRWVRGGAARGLAPWPAARAGRAPREGRGSVPGARDVPGLRSFTIRWSVTQEDNRKQVVVALPNLSTNSGPLRNWRGARCEATGPHWDRYPKRTAPRRETPAVRQTIRGT